MTEHHWSDLAAAYALGSLEPGERSEFEGHLATCTDCQREVDSYQEVAAGLADGAPVMNPPPALRDRVLSRVQDEDLGVQVMAHVAPERLPEASAGRPVFRRVLMGATAASLVLAAGAVFMLQQSNDTRLALERAYESSRAALAERDDTIARQQAILDTLLAPEISTASLVAAAPQAPGLQLFWNRGTNLVVVAAFNLPPAPAGRTYQLWGIRGDDAPVSLGLFDVSPDNTAVTLTASSTETFDVAAVTDEPAAGSSQPTSVPFLVGNWYHGG